MANHPSDVANLYDLIATKLNIPREEAKRRFYRWAYDHEFRHEAENADIALIAFEWIKDMKKAPSPEPSSRVWQDWPAKDETTVTAVDTAS